MKDRRDLETTQAKAEILIEALPYLQKFSGKTFVIKVGGEILDYPEQARLFAQDIMLFRSIGIKTVLCHGGGPQISRAMSDLQIEPNFIDGHRVTDERAREVVMMVLLGQVNRKLVTLLNEFGKRAVGLSGADGRMLEVSQKSPELGFVGTIENVHPTLVEKLLDDGMIPVIASLGVDLTGETYNVNADLVAGELARALDAEKYIILSATEGLYQSFTDKDSLISSIGLEELQQLFDSGTLVEGIIPKVESILLAIKGGVKRAHILDGRMRHSLLLEIFTQEGIGTMISPTS